MSHIKAIDSMWFNTNQGHFGLVLAEDTVTGERKIYGGVCSGLDQKADELDILRLGNKTNTDMLKAMLSKVTPEGSQELGKKSDFMEWLLKPRSRKYSPFVTFRGGAMKAELNLQIPMDEIGEYFGVTELTIDDKTWRKEK